MAGGITLEGDYSLFTAQVNEDVAVLRFNKDLLLRLADLRVKDQTLGYMDRLQESENIKVVLLLSSPDKRGRDEYLEVFSRLLTSKLGRDDLLRLFNAVNQVILRLVGLNKYVVHATSGRVIMMYLSASLACDYRVAADNTMYQNPCLEVGLAPKGGGPFLLARLIGIKAAYDVLLSCYDFSARDALRLGLVHKVAPAADLEQEALRVARHFAQYPSWTLSGLKRLMGYSLRDLADYLEFENRELIRIIDGGSFRKGQAMGLWDLEEEDPRKGSDG
ncbi:MAG: enoyl-CoA hydratase/isomerase family protein [Thermodesulfobacteriota bacterium]